MHKILILDEENLQKKVFLLKNNLVDMIYADRLI